MTSQRVLGRFVLMLRLTRQTISVRGGLVQGAKGEMPSPIRGQPMSKSGAIPHTAEASRGHSWIGPRNVQRQEGAF